MNRKPLYTYLAFAFIPIWILWILCIWILRLPNAVLVTSAGMWCPALALFLTDRIHHLHFPWKDVLKPKIKGNGRSYAFAWFMPVVLVLAGMILYFVIFRNQFDAEFEYLNQQIAAMGQPLTPTTVILITLLQVLTYAPLINCLLAVGEELGWRGFLYPELRKSFSPLKAHLITALIWSLWHLPINMAGHNYGIQYPGYPFIGILAMFMFCLSIGILMSLLYEKTGSVWVCAILHGAVNAAGNFPIIFQKLSYMSGAYTVLGPALNGLIAGLPALVLALILLKKGNQV